MPRAKSPARSPARRAASPTKSPVRSRPAARNGTPPSKPKAKPSAAEAGDDVVSAAYEDLDDLPSFREALLSYKYVAPQLSFLEKAYLERWWTWVCHNVYPPWLAPNLITCCGGSCIILGLLLTLQYSPALSGDAPRWVYIAQALLFFAYQTLDGSDGKQARRTKSGSPLGELMDHGIDSWTIGPIIIMSIDTFAYGVGHPLPWLLLVGAQSCFFTSNLTLIHTGRMLVTDMDTTMILTMCSSFLLGAHWWDGHFPLKLPFSADLPIIGPIDYTNGIQRRHPLGGIIVFNEFISVLGTLQDTFNAYRGPKALKTTLLGTGISACLHQCCFLAAYSALVFVGFNACKSAGRDELLLPLLLCANAAFAEIMGRLLLLRIGRRPIPPITVNFFLLAYFSYTAVSVPGDEGYTRCLYITALAQLWHFTFFIRKIRSGAAALGVKVFRVKGASSWCRL